MKNPKFCITALIFSFFILHFNCFAADQLTITTYYPSPYGVYKILRIYPSPSTDCTSAAACANRGEVCYNMTIDQFLGCIGPSGSSTWTLIGGGGGPGGAGGWTDDGTVVRLTTATDSVGIGTTNPTLAKLQVDNSTILNSQAIYGFGDDTGVHGRGNLYAVRGTSPFGAGVYGAGGAVGVYGTGTTALQGVGTAYGVQGQGGTTGVQGTGGATGVYGWGNTSGVEGQGGTYGVYGQSGTWAGYFVGNVGITGNLGIGAATPNVKLDVDGDIECDLITTTGGSFVYFQTIAGAGNNGQYRLTRLVSSRKYKDNIKDFPLALPIVEKLRPVTFNWKQSGEPDSGLIAEEVAEAYPVLVVYKNGEPESVRYEKLPIILINAIKEQQKEIENLKSAVAELSKKLEANK